MKPTAQLHDGLAQLGLNLSEPTQSALLEYLQLMLKWNKVHNLSAIRDLPNMITHHLLDSLSVLSYVKGQHIIDIGTGGGLPGIPLAIVQPDKEFILLDSIHKKTAFLQLVCHSLQLKNVTVINERVENYHPDQKFDVVISRAFASLHEFLSKTQHLLSKSGKFIAMKGRYPDSELEEITNQYTIVSVDRLIVPGIEAERHVVIIEGKSCE